MANSTQAEVSSKSIIQIVFSNKLTNQSLGYGQGNSLRVGVSLASIQELLREAEALPVDLESETKHIRAAVESATSWIVTNTSVLSILKIPITSVDLSLSPDIFAAISADHEHTYDHATDHIIESSAGAMEDGVNEALKLHLEEDSHIDSKIAHTGDSVGYADVKLLMESASGLVVKFPELT